MSERPSLTRAFAHTFTARTGIIVLGFVTGVILARVLGPEGRGRLALVAVTMRLLHPLGSLVTGANDILAGERPERQGRLLGQTLIWSTVVCLVLLPLWLVAPNSLRQFALGSESLSFVALLLIFLWFSMTETALRQMVLARQAFFFTNRILVSGSVVYLALVAGLVWYWDLGVVAAVWAMIAKEVVLVILELWWLSRDPATELPQALGIDTELLHRSVEIGKRVVVTTVPTVLLLKVDMWLLSALGDASHVGIYRVAVGVCMLLNTAPQELNRIIKAKGVSEIGGSERAGLVGKLVFCLAILVYGLLLLVGRELFELVYGTAFSGSYDVAMVLLGAVAFWGATNPLAGYVVAKREYPRRVAFGMALALLVNIGLNWWLIPRYHGQGAAAASLVAYAIMAYVYTTEFLDEASLDARWLLTLSGWERRRLRSLLRDHLG